MTNETRRMFELDGGPDDGFPLIVEVCRHGNWPDLQNAKHKEGLYRYNEQTDRYTWIETPR